jgi:hypothetical protein
MGEVSASSIVTLRTELPREPGRMSNKGADGHALVDAVQLVPVK